MIHLSIPPGMLFLMEVIHLISLERNGFTPDMIKEILTYQKGSRNLQFRYNLLDKADKVLGDITPLMVADSNSVSMDNMAEIHRTASFRVRDTGEINYLSERIQPYARLWIPPGPVLSRDFTFLEDTQPILYDSLRKAPQEGGWAEFPLGVFLLSTPEKEYEGNMKFRNIEAYDKLQILVDDGFNARYIADEGDNIVDEVIALLQDAGLSKINIESSSKELPTWLSWDPGVTRLEVINQLLGIINYEPIYVDEYGYFSSRPYRSPEQRASEYEYRTDQYSVIEPGAKARTGYFAVPNEWVGVVSEPDRVPLTYTYQNTNPDSPTSIGNKGWTKTKYIDVEAVDIESLRGIVEKQAYKDSQVLTEMEFSTAVMPFHSHSDVYRVQHHKLDVDAKFEELGWSMDLRADGSMSHRARQVIATGGV